MMGKVWMHDLPDICRDAGVAIKLVDGWETRSRSSGGLDGLWALGTHHTASNTTPENDTSWMWHNAANAARPIGNVLAARDGTVWIGASGATNTQGKGGPVRTSRGVIPLDAGNRYFMSIEIANDGRGQRYPGPQIEAVERLLAGCCVAWSLDPATDVISHAVWAPGRKVDPAGPTPTRPSWGGMVAPPVTIWPDVEVARSVYGRIREWEDEMVGFRALPIPRRVLDTRGGQRFKAREARRVDVSGVVPAGTRSVFVSVAAIDPADPGWMIAWTSGTMPQSSFMNPLGGATTSGGTFVQLDALGGFVLFSETACDVIVDVSGVGPS